MSVNSTRPEHTSSEHEELGDVVKFCNLGRIVDKKKEKAQNKKNKKSIDFFYKVPATASVIGDHKNYNNEFIIYKS